MLDFDEGEEKGKRVERSESEENGCFEHLNAFIPCCYKNHDKIAENVDALFVLCLQKYKEAVNIFENLYMTTATGLRQDC